MTDKTDLEDVELDIMLKNPNPFTNREKERAWRSAMKAIRDLGEDPDTIVREATETVEFWRDHPYRAELEQRVQQLLKANNEELERRREAVELFDKVADGLIARVRQLEKKDDRKFVFGFMAGFCLAYLILEGLRWLLS